MLDTILFLGTFCIVPVIHGSHKVACDSSDSFKANIAFSFLSVTLRAFIVNDAGVAAARISVNRMVNGAVSDAVFLHTSYNLFEGIKILEGISVKFYI